MKISFLLTGKTESLSLLKEMEIYEERIRRYSAYTRVEIPELKKVDPAAVPVAAPVSSMDSYGANVPLSDEDIPF